MGCPRCPPALAAALGVEAMTLYHYVPTKAALLDGMVERVLAQAAGDLARELDPAQSRWPEVVRAVATRFRAVLLAHPGVLGAMATRPVNSPGAIRILEAGLAIMTSQGVPLALAMDTLNSVMMFVIGHTLAEAGQTPGHEGTEPGPPALILRRTRTSPRPCAPEPAWTSAAGSSARWTS